MTRLIPSAIAALFVGAGALAAAPVATHAAAHPTHRAGAPSGQYYESVIYPRGAASISHGSLATVPGTTGLRLKFYTGYLKPDIIYREDLMTGRCGTAGSRALALPRAQADPDGSINFLTSVNPSVLAGKTLHATVTEDTPGAAPVACGDIYPAAIVLPLHAVKTNVVNGASGVALFNAGVRGNEVLYKAPNATGTNVVIFAQGLEPSTTHESHIHNGQCIPDENNQVRYDLYYMETDPNGEGVVGTFFNGRLDLANSYVQVHAATLQSATCGDFGGNGLPTMTP